MVSKYHKTQTPQGIWVGFVLLESLGTGVTNWTEKQGLQTLFNVWQYLKRSHREFNHTIISQQYPKFQEL